jgi:high-affinity iron transporter
MKSGLKTALAAALFLAAVSAAGSAQENSAKRLSSIVSVAVEEYRKAVDAQGKLISQDEYTETSEFLRDATMVAQRLRGYNAPLTQALLDTLIQAVERRALPADVRLIHERFKGALGAAGALDMPSAPLDTARGHALFAQHCLSCHDDRGLGEGIGAKGLPLPVPPIGSARLTPNLTPTLAYNVVSGGIRGTPMVSFAETLTPQDRWNVVNYVYMLRGTKMDLPAAPADASAAPGAAAAHSVLALLDSALDFARSGRTAEAGDRAFDAYIAFEPLETPARARQPGLVSTMERHFADL